MQDEQDMRMLETHRAAFFKEIDALLKSVMDAFRILNRIEWAAPWLKGRC